MTTHSITINWQPGVADSAKSRLQRYIYSLPGHVEIGFPMMQSDPDQSWHVLMDDEAAAVCIFETDVRIG